MCHPLKNESESMETTMERMRLGKKDLFLLIQTKTRFFLYFSPNVNSSISFQICSFDPSLNSFSSLHPPLPSLFVPYLFHSLLDRIFFFGSRVVAFIWVRDLIDPFLSEHFSTCCCCCCCVRAYGTVLTEPI